jgi:hypothetical protein
MHANGPPACEAGCPLYVIDFIGRLSCPEGLSPHYRPANRSAIAAWIPVAGGSKSWPDADACLPGTIAHEEETNVSSTRDIQLEKCSWTYFIQIPYPVCSATNARLCQHCVTSGIFRKSIR